MKKNIKKFLATGVAATLVATGSQVVATPSAQAAPGVQFTANANGFRVEPWMLGIGAAAGIGALIALIAGILGSSSTGGSSFASLPAGSEDIELPSTDNNQTDKPLDAFRAEMLNELRAWRKTNAPANASEIQLDASLNAGAQEWAEHMAKTGKFEHPTTGNFIENIWMGSYRPVEKDVISVSWANSPGHNQNMANSSITKVGFGIAKGSNGNYYVVFRGQ